MNRSKREALRNHVQARTGLTPDQAAALDEQDDESARLTALASQIHRERFPEEYDFMYDSSWDAFDRKKGINPMTQAYIDEVKRRRAAFGVTQLTDAGMPVSSDSRDLCWVEARRQLESANGASTDS
jgi:hypothetical protein